MQPIVRRSKSTPEEIEPEFLLKAYQLGVFPMAMHDGEIAWFSPDPRGIIPLDDFHIPHGLKRTLKKERFDVRFDTAFEAVMMGCADRSSTWIDETILSSYCELHDHGFAHSVETWGKRRAGWRLVWSFAWGRLFRRIDVQPRDRCLQSRLGVSRQSTS